MPLRVVFGAEAADDLRALQAYISVEAGSGIATSFVDDIVAHRESFATFPKRGRLRDDIRPGLRIIGFRRRVSIAFVVEPERVVILGILYAGHDPNRDLRPDTLDQET